MPEATSRSAPRKAPGSGERVLFPSSLVGFDYCQKGFLLVGPLPLSFAWSNEAVFGAF